MLELVKWGSALLVGAVTSALFIGAVRKEPDDLLIQGVGENGLKDHVLFEVVCTPTSDGWKGPNGFKVKRIKRIRI